MDTNQQKRRGRPPGLFEYNKLLLLNFLQINTPYTPNMQTMRQDLAAFGLEVCERQLSRYLHDLEREVTPDGLSRISILKTLLREQQGDTRQRIIVCNDKRELKF